MKAGILIPVLTSKDAVGADALSMARILDEMGIETRVFCLAANDIERDTWPADKLVEFAGGADDLVIYHYSTGWPLAVDLLKRCAGRRVVKYHNITPPQYFRGISDDYESACEKGRREIAVIAKLGLELYLADSAYNLGELIAAGAPRERGAVLAPFHRVEDIVAAEADTALLDELTDGSRNFLMVGRVAPNKGHFDLIEAFGAYARAHEEPSRLILLGKIDQRLSSYVDTLRRRIEELDIADCVMWLNAASEAQLKAAYLASHAFMLLSQHEGFCVPLIEAMAVGTPIIARATSAVPETLGAAGITWEESDPWLYAASAARIFADRPLRHRLRDAGFARYREVFAIDVLRAGFVQHIEALA